MRCVDVNVLVYAHRADLADHEAYRDLLEQLANGDEPLGLPDAVLSGFLRIITNKKIFKDPTDVEEAWHAVDALLDAPATVPLTAGSGHWNTFHRLAEHIDARGNDITDAFLAAFAVENNAVWLSADRGFARFGEVTWRHPLDDKV